MALGHPDPMVEKAQAQAQAFGLPAVYADFDTMFCAAKTP
jgi:predicted dehydrogenase